MDEESKPDELDPEVVKKQIHSAIERIRKKVSEAPEPHPNPEGGGR
jgi:hypothetical protein